MCVQDLSPLNVEANATAACLPLKLHFPRTKFCGKEMVRNKTVVKMAIKQSHKNKTIKLRVNNNFVLISIKLLAMGNHDQVNTTLKTRVLPRKCENSNNLHVHVLGVLQNCQAKYGHKTSQLEFSKFLLEVQFFV